MPRCSARAPRWTAGRYRGRGDGDVTRWRPERACATLGVIIAVNVARPADLARRSTMTSPRRHSALLLNAPLTFARARTAILVGVTNTTDELIERALAEDVGDGDVTVAATVDPGARGVATITQKVPGVISGLGVAEAVFLRLDPEATVERLGPEGEWREAPAPVLRVTGAAGALLTAERTALNFLGRLSGIATLTASVVRSIEAAGGTAKLLDTRKTTPGLRALEKQAVADGGGVNHRAGLYDFILIKENHAALAGGVFAL